MASIILPRSSNSKPRVSWTVASFGLGELNDTIASEYARDMRTTPQFILSMKSYDMQYAEWACYGSNMTDHAVKLEIPFDAIEKMPKAKTPPTHKGPDKSEPHHPVPEPEHDARGLRLLVYHPMMTTTR